MSSQQGYTCLIDLFLSFSAVPLGLEWRWWVQPPHSQCVQSTTKEKKTVSERERESCSPSQQCPGQAARQPQWLMTTGCGAAPQLAAKSTATHEADSPNLKKEWERESVRSPLPPRLFFLGCLSLFRSCLLSLFTYTLFFPDFSPVTFLLSLWLC